MIFANSLPGFKGLVSVAPARSRPLSHITAYVAAFVLHRSNELKLSPCWSAPGNLLA